MAVEAIGIACEVVGVVKAVASVITIGHNRQLYQARNDEGLETWQKVMQRSLGAFCICIEPPPVSIDLVKVDPNSLPKGEQLGFVVGQNSLDLAARIMTSMDKPLQSDHLIDPFSYVCLDIAAIAPSGCDFTPVCFGREVNPVSTLIHSMKGGSLIVVQCGEPVEQAAFTVFQKIAQLIPRAGEPLAPRITIRIVGEQHPPRLILDPRMEGEVRTLLRVKDIGEIGVIPAIFSHDPALKKYRCPITQKPIREIVGVAPSPLINPTYYEARSVLNWLKTRLGEHPPNWPLSVPVVEVNLQRDVLAQREINDRLQQLVNDLQGIKIDFVEHCISRRAREILGRKNPAFLGGALAQEIRRNKTISFALCSTQLRSFSGNSPVVSHKIECGIRSIDSPVSEEPIHPSLFEKFGAILLGEPRQNEDKILEIAQKRLRSINFYFSQDLSHWEIQPIPKPLEDLAENLGCCCFF